MKVECVCGREMRAVEDESLSVEFECGLHGDVMLFGKDFDFDD